MQTPLLPVMFPTRRTTLCTTILSKGGTWIPCSAPLGALLPPPPWTNVPSTKSRSLASFNCSCRYPIKPDTGDDGCLLKNCHIPSNHLSYQVENPCVQSSKEFLDSLLSPPALGIILSCRIDPRFRGVVWDPLEHSAQIVFFCRGDGVEMAKQLWSTDGIGHVVTVNTSMLTGVLEVVAITHNPLKGEVQYFLMC